MALGLTEDAERCRVEALQTAVAQIHNPVLTALYQDNAGKEAARFAKG